MGSSYKDFLARKKHANENAGFAPLWIPDFLFDFQKHLVEWAIVKGRGAIFADCGLGKTPMQLVWAENVVRKTNGRVLILTPLAVANQTEAEGRKFDIAVHHCKDGKPRDGINVVNYERLHLFDPEDFVGVVCDESSILKNYAGATRNAVIDFMAAMDYRLLCSATPAPNDVMELGNSVEALGVTTRTKMLAMYFTHDGGETAKWRIKGHAKDPFWSFVCSWARAIRKPSDLGFQDGRMVLPELDVKVTLVDTPAPPGFLFPMECIGLNEQREERRRTITERCEACADIANSDPSPSIAWCSLNAEDEMLTKMIDGSGSLRGSMKDDEKEEVIKAFQDGDIRVLVTKPQMAAFGMNWQHCHRMSFFPSHSHEQFYQAVRRCWRFGQTQPVSVDIVSTEAESLILENLMEKERRATEMFAMIVKNMASHYRAQSTTYHPTIKMEIPSWL